MNEIINKFLLEGDEFIREMHFKKPGFTYNVCGTFTKNIERIKKFKKAGDSRHIYKNELKKACFQHDMAYGDFKDLSKRTASDKVLRDRAFKIGSSPKYVGYQRGLASLVYKLFDKKSSGSGTENEVTQNQQIGEELHKPIIRKLKKSIFIFKDHICTADLADMLLISKFNKGIILLLCVFDIFSKYAWIIPLKDKKKNNYC